MQFEDLPNIGIVLEDLHPDFIKRINKNIQTFKKQFKGNQSPDLLHQFYLRGRVPQPKSENSNPDYNESVIKTGCSLQTDLKNDIFVEVLRVINFYEKKYRYFSKLYGYMAGGLQHDENIYELESINVNIQRKGEFFPIHRHSGIYTFVIWVDIPFYKTKKFTNKFSKDVQVGNTDLTGYLQFLYTDILGNISTWNLPIDKNWEGKLCVFPAEMHHQVYPFFDSDDLRVIITGNVSVSNKKILQESHDIIENTNKSKNYTVNKINKKMIIFIGIILVMFGFLNIYFL